jgi:ABC-2 type transport system permease protein
VLTGTRLAAETRSFGAATRFHLRDLCRTRTEVLLNLVIPIFYASIAYFLFLAGGRRADLTGLMIGTGLMGMWSTMLYGAATAIKNQRILGTLEVLLGAPKSFPLVIAPITTAASVFGAFAVVATCAWGVVVFRAPLRPAELPTIALASLVTAVAMGAFGLLVAAVFVLARRAESMVSPLIAPLWMVSGIVVPVAVLPGAYRPVARMIPLSWGADALRAAAHGQPFGVPLLWCVAVAAVFLVLGCVAVSSVRRSARRTGEVNLW